MLLVFALALLGGALAQDVTVHMKLKQHWSGNFEGSFSYTPSYGIKGWELKIHFSVPVHSLQVNPPGKPLHLQTLLEIRSIVIQSKHR